MGRSLDDELAPAPVAVPPIARVVPTGPADPRPEVEPEPLVLDADHPAALHGQVAAAGPGPGGRGRWPGRRARRPAPASRPPAARGRAPEMASRPMWNVSTSASPVPVVAAPRRSDRSIRPKRQRLVADVELLEPGQAGPDDTSRSVRDWKVPPRPRSSTPSSMRVGVAAHGIEARVGQVHEVLLGLSLLFHRTSDLPTPSGSGEPSIVCARSRRRDRRPASARRGARSPRLGPWPRTAGPRRRPKSAPGAHPTTRPPGPVEQRPCRRRPEGGSPTLRSSRPAGACRSPGARCGSCARPAGRCPSTGRRAAIGSILEAIADPELAAELTLQPVRRYGVDAAILFSDIVVPVARRGVRGRRGPGRRPGRRPSRSVGPADLERLRPLEPEADVALRGRGGPACWPSSASGVPLIGFAGAPFTVASYLVEGGPSRNFARMKALMHGEPEIWDALMDRLADWRWPSCAPRWRPGPPPCSSSTAGPAASRPATTSASSCRPPGASSPGWPTSACRPSCSAWAPASCSASWRRPGPTWWASTGGCRSTRPAARVGPGRAVQGNLDPAVCLAAVAGGGGRDPATCSELAGTAPGHVFNLGHGVLPETDPGILERPWSNWSTPRDGPAWASVSPARRRSGGGRPSPTGVLVMAHGTPASPEGIEAFYTAHPAGPAAHPRAAGRADRALPGHRGHLPARPRGPGPRWTAWPRRWRAATRAGSWCARGQVHRPHHRGGGGRAGRARRRPRRRASCSPRTSRSPGSGRVLAAGRAGAAGRSTVPADITPVRRGTGAQGFAELLAERTGALLAPAGRTPGSTAVVFHRPLAARAGGGRGDPYPDQVADSAADVAGRPASTTEVDWRVAWQSAGRTPDPWLGPDVLRRDPTAGRPRAPPRWWCARSASWPTTSRSSTTSTSRPAGVAGQAAWPSPGRPRSTTTRGSSRSWPGRACGPPTLDRAPARDPVARERGPRA